MRYAETGYNLEIDLSRGNIERVETDPRLTELHLGGLGTNAKILWDRVPPETDPFSPDNLLIFSTGLLGGTPAPGANRTIITAYSPQTLLMGYSMMGGFLAPELKYAGYDKIIFRGKSPELVYLWINNDKVEIRDASHLQGKGAVETAELIRQELNEPNAQVAAIGLAGENRVYMASIEQGRSSASRLGLGAVMGDKGIKAIAVRGTKDVNLARPAEFYELCNDVLKYIKYRNENPVPNVMTIFGGLGSPKRCYTSTRSGTPRTSAWGNSRVRRKDFWNKEIEEKWKRVTEKVRKRLISCYNCPMKCGAIISVPGISTYMMKCFSKLTYTMAAFVETWILVSRSLSGPRSTEWTDSRPRRSWPLPLSFREAGILTDEDFEGCPSDNEGKILLAARQNRPPRRDWRYPGRWRLLGSPEDRKRGRSIRPQQLSRNMSSCPSSLAC